MEIYRVYVEPKVLKAVRYGVNNTKVTIDEIMKPEMFTERNMEQLSNFIRKQVKLKCELTKEENWFGGKRFILDIWW